MEVLVNGSSVDVSLVNRGLGSGIGGILFLGDPSAFGDTILGDDFGLGIAWEICAVGPACMVCAPTVNRNPHTVQNAWPGIFFFPQFPQWTRGPVCEFPKSSELSVAPI